ncbi:MAG: hypothetical protein SOU07_04360 [Bacilli bacterium]|nr:hypothetical protein [Acholeplasmataceae bacterium]MDY2902653.1 hypothetical protein [Bacilli bacterium]
MKNLVKALERLPWIVRVLLVLLYGAYGNLIRLFKSIAANNVLGIVLALILLLCGGFVILWIVDLICVLLGKPIWWID